MELKERPIIQTETEPPRRFFTDDKNLEILLWYQEAAFKNLVGFQIGYRKNTLNTDDEFFITMTPNGKIQLGKLRGPEGNFPASKMIHKTSDRPSPQMMDACLEAFKYLPFEISAFLQSKFVLVQNLKS